MKITTWNVNSLKTRLPYVMQWVLSAEPDVLCLQETKMDQDAFPAWAFELAGYEFAHYGKPGGRNGVAIISKVGLEDVQRGFAESTADVCEQADHDARIVWATCGGVRIASAYIPNGKSLDHDDYGYKLRWYERLLADLNADHSQSDPVVVVGDFNVAPADQDVWDIRDFDGMTHVTAAEREHWQALCDWGLDDVFRQRYGDADTLYTCWDYTELRFPKNKGTRIDHILASAPVSQRLSWIILDRNARKDRICSGEKCKPSDHAPLTACFDLD